jgi:hypothetical protein
LDDWFWEVGAIDDWLIDAVKATIRLWDDNPDGGNAKLDPAHAWFTVSNLGEEKTWPELTRFSPVFDSPYPLWRGPDPGKIRKLLEELSTEDSLSAFGEMEAIGWLEPLKAYEKRIG